MTLDQLIDRAVAMGAPDSLGYAVRMLSRFKEIDLYESCELRFDADSRTVHVRIGSLVDQVYTFEEIEAYFHDEGPTGPAPEVSGECPAGAPCLPGE